MKEGDAKFAAKDWTGALRAYQAAHAIMQVPTTGLPLAKAQVEKRLLVEARDTLLQAARYPKDAGEPAAIAKARDEAATLAAKIAPMIPSLVITIESPTSSAAVEVSVDGTAVSAAALSAPRKMNPGSHTVVAFARGYHNATLTVNLNVGETRKVALKLTPEDGSGATDIASKGEGRLRIESASEPGNVFLDGKAVGATPLEISAPGGVHKVEIQYPGGTHEEKTVTVTPGGKEIVSFQPSKLDAAARHRKGLHIGIAGGPSMAVLLDGGSPLYAGTASFVLNIGITPAFEFRTGFTATVLARFNEGNQFAQISTVIPASLRIRYSPWFAIAAGLSAGFAADLGPGETLYGFSIGPEWSVFSMSAGEKHEFELAFVQGLRFGHTRDDYHQALVFTYLLLD